MSTTALTPELLDLMEHEKVIEQGLATFVEVGCALVRIRDGKKYRATGYATFEDYCRQRWGFSDGYARRLMLSAEIVGELETVPMGTVSPTAERQVRPLAKLPEPERADAWVEAVELANGDVPTAAAVAEVVDRRRQTSGSEHRDEARKTGSEQRTPMRVPKPASPGAPPHPAPFSDAVLDAFRELLAEHDDGAGRRVVDPFAGTGRIHELQQDGWQTIGVELEPEWARLHSDTICGDSRLLEDLLYDHRPIDAIATSPAYGNRLADSYDAIDPEARRSYAIDLGRSLSDGNGAGLQWGEDYRALHQRVWEECSWLLRPGGLLLLNCKDHQRDGRIVAVTGWHVRCLVELGLAVVDLRTLRSGGLPFTTAEPLSELVVAFRNPRR
jgi:SAM-dependent methyltransferase